MGKKIIAVFGGAFNPPANSHVNLAKQILEKNGNIEKIIFVPVSIRYNKQGLASNEDRFQMLSEVCKNNEQFGVSAIEINSDKQLYTIQTLKLIQQQYKQHEICFILGTDNLKELETWYHVDELLENFKILVIERNDDIAKDIIESNTILNRHKSSFIILENIEKIDLSSTIIREKVKKGEDISNLVPAEIRNKILEIYS